jgi:Fur family zinc uptake transcriptional regulator
MTAASFEDRLRAAELRLAHTGQPLIGTRRRVMELLLQAKEPLKGYDLIARVSALDGPVTPMVIYRALHTLGDAGLLHSISSRNAFTPCQLGPAEHQPGFLLCRGCGTTLEFDLATTPVAALYKKFRRFELAEIEVEAHGLCRLCQEGLLR